MKKLLTVITLTLLFAGSTITFYEADSAFATVSSFKDVKPSHWAYGAIQNMVQKGILKGYKDGTFRPSEVVTTGEFLKMAVMAENPQSEVTNSKTFHWAKNYYDEAERVGLLNHQYRKDGRVYLELTLSDNIDSNISYEERERIKNSKELSLQKTLGIPMLKRHAVIIITNILEKKEGEITVPEGLHLKDIPRGDISMKKDIHCKSESYIYKAYAAGVVTGIKSTFINKFYTKNQVDSLTRAEAATLLDRLLNKEKRIKPEVKKIENYYKKDNVKVGNITLKTGNKLTDIVDLSSCRVDEDYTNIRPIDLKKDTQIANEYEVLSPASLDFTVTREEKWAKIEGARYGIYNTSLVEMEILEHKKKTFGTGRVLYAIKDKKAVGGEIFEATRVIYIKDGMDPFSMRTNLEEFDLIDLWAYQGKEDYMLRKEYWVHNVPLKDIDYFVAIPYYPNEEGLSLKSKVFVNPYRDRT